MPDDVASSRHRQDTRRPLAAIAALVHVDADAAHPTPGVVGR